MTAVRVVETLGTRLAEVIRDRVRVTGAALPAGVAAKIQAGQPLLLTELLEVGQALGVKPSDLVARAERDGVAAVTCPAWCSVSQADHLAELDNWEGRSIHWSATRNGPDWDVRAGANTFSDGTPDPSDPPMVHVQANSVLTPQDAESFALALMAAAREARSL